MRLALSQADVQRLMTDPSTEARSEAASKVSATYVSNGLPEQERVIA
jgi:hypothetical protein